MSQQPTDQNYEQYRRLQVAVEAEQSRLYEELSQQRAMLKRLQRQLDERQDITAIHQTLDRHHRQFAKVARAYRAMNARVLKLERHPSNSFSPAPAIHQWRCLRVPARVGIGTGLTLFVAGGAAFILAGGFTLEYGGVRLQRPELSSGAIAAIAAGGVSMIGFAKKGGSE